MKKLLFIISAALCFFACSKENTVSDENADSNLEFSFDVFLEETRGTVKDGWNLGDRVFVFFQDVTGGYLELRPTAEYPIKWGVEIMGNLSSS
ncbi:MAG: hypothetical protein K6F25_08165, partial [Bacteroidales bacterium]|nr:hypothetical protein [Bacteroidales bacterium]